jgi:hypothetical protein
VVVGLQKGEAAAVESHGLEPRQAIPIASPVQTRRFTVEPLATPESAAGLSSITETLLLRPDHLQH